MKPFVQVRTRSVLVILMFTIAHGENASGQWITDGVPICTAPNGQGSQVITTDGAGGAVIVWGDARNGTSDVYAQRIGSSGLTLWDVDGVPLCLALGGEHELAVAPDGNGGAIVVWADERAGTQEDDIYAQRVSASGAPLWTTNGVAICTAPGEQRRPAIVADGGGGVVIVWDDARNGSANLDIYLQVIDAAGIVGGTPDGAALCASPLRQVGPAIESDEAGGAIVVWMDGRAGYEDGDLFAQRITIQGDAVWVPNGVPVCEYGTDQTEPRVVPDGTGGAIIAWIDRFWIQWEKSDIYAQRLDAAGDMVWAERGVGLSTDFYDDPNQLGLTPAGSESAIAAWSASGDIFAQRVDPTGNAQWTPNGVMVCDASGEQYLPVITTDGAGGAIIAWRDDGPGHPDVRAGRVNPSGNVLWGS